MIGKQLGHYKIVSQLGRGGMASVYMAEQLGLERRVALKILQPSLAADEIIVQRFQQEARIAANLHHNHVVTIYDVGEVDEVYYIAMRYIEGENLGQLLRREGPLEPIRALAMLSQVSEALDFAHSRGVLHRDIKPANVMVEPGDILTLTDFGIARAGEASHLTATQMVIGTPEYMSPEQAQGQPVDKRSDLYALGVLMYEALGGRPPFTAASTPSLLYLHVHEPPPPLHQLRPDLPRALSDVVGQALSKDPNDRFPSGRDMVAAARTSLEAPPAPPPQPDGPSTSDVTAATMFDPSFGRSPRTPVRPDEDVSRPTPVPRRGPGTSPRTPLPMPPGGGGRTAPPPPPGSGARPDPARVGTRTLTPPPRADLDRGASGTIMAPGPTDDRSRGRKGSNTWLIGPAVVAIALLAVGLLVLTQSGLLDSVTGTAKPTAVPKSTVTTTQTAAGQTPAPKPADQPTAVTKPADQPTAAPKPTDPPTVAPKPTDPPTVAPKPTVPPTPNPTQRVTSAQAAVAAGNFPAAIQELESVRQDPAVKADQSLAASVDESLRQAHITFGNQLLEQGKLDDSYGQFAEALKIVPTDAQALDGQKRVILVKNYGIMEANWGKDDEAAMKALEDNMLIDPEFRDTRVKLYALLIAKADRLLGGGDRDGAYPILMHALEIIPDRPEARQRLQPYTPTPTPVPPPPTAQPAQPKPSNTTPSNTTPSNTTPSNPAPFVPPGTPV